MALAGVAWLGREPLLRAAADMWIVSDELAPADAVAVFGGGIDDRPFAAAAYFRDGLTKKILVSNVGLGAAARLGAVASHGEANRTVLLRLGVPESAIEVLGDRLANTHDEALALRHWAERSGARTIVVPTEIFAARRLRWMLRSLFPEPGAVRVAALDPPTYRRDDWWRHELGLIDFQNEVIKYVYYRLHY